jgi:hypothetical protein
MWRGVGAAALVTGYAIGAFADPAASLAAGVATLGGFVMAITGLILMVQGRRVPAAIRIELSRHRLLPQAIHARRHAR